jgi:hypothetical protein
VREGEKKIRFLSPSLRKGCADERDAMMGMRMRMREA